MVILVFDIYSCEIYRTYRVRDYLISKQVHHGVVVSRFGNRAEVENDQGQLISCHIRRALSDLVTGDHVNWEWVPEDDDDNKGVITKIHERTSVLKRPIRYQGLKPVAANIDQVLVVTAVEPPFTDRILDRYLVAIEQSGIDAVLILNKTDLIIAGHPVRESMTIYQALGYKVIETSCKQDDIAHALTDVLAHKTSVFVGQSGVGKSSLVNQILPEVKTDVASLSETSGLGTHTTTTSRLYHLDHEAVLIDSPGIREFGMDHLDTQQIASGFIEIAEFSQQCKFRDCSHVKEPGCAVKQAVASGDIHQNRYDNYLYLYEESMAE